MTVWMHGQVHSTNDWTLLPPISVTVYRLIPDMGTPQSISQARHCCATYESITLYVLSAQNIGNLLTPLNTVLQEVNTRQLYYMFLKYDGCNMARTRRGSVQSFMGGANVIGGGIDSFRLNGHALMQGTLTNRASFRNMSIEDKILRNNAERLWSAQVPLKKLVSDRIISSNPRYQEHLRESKILVL